MSTAVITGAASSIGAGLAREAVRRGMTVVLADWDGDALAALAKELGIKPMLMPPTSVTPQRLRRWPQQLLRTTAELTCCSTTQVC